MVTDVTVIVEANNCRSQQGGHTINYMVTDVTVIVEANKSDTP